MRERCDYSGRLRVGALQGSDSVSTRYPPVKPLPDPPENLASYRLIQLRPFARMLV